MKVTQIMVQLQKRVSNGNYGHEGVEGQWIATLEPGDDPISSMQVLLDRGREQLLHHLKASENRNVRLAVNPAPRLCEECKQPLNDTEEYEHDACSKARQGRERLAREQREREYQERLRPPRDLVAVPTADNDDTNDDSHGDDDDGEEGTPF